MIILLSDLHQKNGYTEIVKLLLLDPRVDPGAQNNFAIRFASVEGHTEMVKLLLADPRVDPSFDNNIVIRSATQCGHTEIVKFLLADPRVNPQDNTNDQDIDIQIAMVNGHWEIVKLLLTDPRVDPSYIDDRAMLEAAKCENWEILELLEKHDELYPNAIIRHHNLPLQNQIQKLEDIMFSLQEQQEFYIERFEEIREMYKRGIPVNPKAEMIIDLHLDILKSEIGKLSDQIIRLKKEQEEFYISNL